MKTFTTSIYVPHTAKKDMNVVDVVAMETDLNKAPQLPTDLSHGGLDDIQLGEEFIIRVNGTHERHEIKMRGIHGGVGKVKFMFVDPSDPAVHRFAEWRIKKINLMGMKNGAELQLRDFGPIQLRRLMRHALAKGERNLVTYR